MRIQSSLKNIGKAGLLLLTAFALSSCVSSTAPVSPPGAGSTKHSANTPHSHSSDNTTALLYAQLNEWRGTPYLLGGNTKRGIDCSGFVKQTFAQRFGQQVPRTTELLAKQGRKISRNSLQAGDLVFFKTGRGVRHVGVYVKDGNFVHASKSAGVTLSNINGRYWKSRYWQSRRLPTP